MIKGKGKEVESLRKRLVVFDLDGTLAPIGQGMSQENIDLLKKISEKGMKIAICSGKPTYYLCGFVRQMGIPDMILLGENGAVIQFGINLPPQIYCTLPYERSVKSALRQIEEDIGDMLPDIWFQPNSVGVTPFPRNEEEFQKIEDYMKEHEELLEGIETFRHVDSVDFVPSGLTKYDGLQKLTQMTGIMADEMIAVGDGVKDAPMFRYAGLSLGIQLPEEDMADRNFASITESMEYILSLLQEQKE